MELLRQSYEAELQSVLEEVEARGDDDEQSVATDTLTTATATGTASITSPRASTSVRQSLRTAGVVVARGSVDASTGDRITQVTPDGVEISSTII